MAARWGRTLLLLFVVALGISLWRVSVVERQRRAIADQYAEASKMVEDLKQERTQLNTQLVDARQTVEGQAGRITNLQAELQNVDNHLKESLAELSALKLEHEELAKSHAALKEQFQFVEAEKKQLEFRLSSLVELKKAIKVVKREVWNQRLAAWRERIQAQHEEDLRELASGNRGYMVRNGTSTAKASSQLQVHVLEPQPQ